MCNIQLVGSCCITQGAWPGPCGDLEGWNGGGGKEALQKGNICIHTADPQCCIAETHTTLKKNYTANKFNSHKKGKGYLDFCGALFENHCLIQEIILR